MVRVVVVCIALVACSHGSSKPPLKSSVPAGPDCYQAAQRIGTVYGGDQVEKQDTNAAIEKACVDGAWPSSVLACAVNAKGEANPYDCTEQLSDAQQAAFHKAVKEVSCKYNDCVPQDYVPMPAPGGSDDDLGL